MRTKKPQPFDPEKQYNPGERSVCRGMVIVAERWNKKAEILLSKNRCPFPLLRCNICKDRFKFDSAFQDNKRQRGKSGDCRIAKTDKRRCVRETEN